MSERGKNKLYKVLEISGSFLVPCFSIYVLEIKRADEKWFYIGMTGDSHYPSARTAFHRIAGHLELNSKSTQNQLRIAIEKKLKVNSYNDMKELSIRMYHFPIDGYVRLTKEKLNNEVVKRLQLTDGYKNYKTMQKKVLELENLLIFELKDKLLNKTKRVRLKTTVIAFPEIYKNVIELVKNE